jgi:hypothetical protein
MRRGAVSRGRVRGIAQAVADRWGDQLISLGAGALSVYCFLDVVVVLAILDVVDDVWPWALYGSLVVFAIGMFAPALQSAVERRMDP